MDSIDDLFVASAIDEVDAEPMAKELALGIYLSHRVDSGLSHLAAMAFAVAELLELTHQQAMSVAVATLNEHASDATPATRH
ncbi:hypothetical protein [Bradyrhizobium iriomotense]|uniref:hypothetical protein n=1 Tax=Bradyrhizobium iriomotense TaxID=441950 RepID=UPI001B89FA34|nr:hypothetical protein [Bradyrhizobium iriomotense]MBR1130951.1 hypothetical protein [Bradyrhizobium iriomotense]